MSYTIPHISSNGTDRHTLIAQQESVRTAAHALHQALIHARPHGRDYQHTPTALRLSITESMADILAVRGILDRAEAILDAMSTTMPCTTSPSAASSTLTEH